MADEHRKPAMVIDMDGERREISYEELTLSNNITLEALVRLLARKGIITPDEFVKQLEELQNERFPEQENRPNG
ncbi:hypothetical protein J7M00_07725 [bacterium]|nr:hypothetical protein [bacterium]